MVFSFRKNCAGNPGPELRCHKTPYCLKKQAIKFSPVGAAGEKLLGTRPCRLSLLVQFRAYGQADRFNRVGFSDETADAQCPGLRDMLVFGETAGNDGFLLGMDIKQIDNRNMRLLRSASYYAGGICGAIGCADEGSASLCQSIVRFVPGKTRKDGMDTSACPLF